MEETNHKLNQSLISFDANQSFQRDSHLSKNNNNNNMDDLPNNIQVLFDSSANKNQNNDYNLHHKYSSNDKIDDQLMSTSRFPIQLHNYENGNEHDANNLVNEQLQQNQVMDQSINNNVGNNNDSLMYQYYYNDIDQTNSLNASFNIGENGNKQQYQQQHQYQDHNIFTTQGDLQLTPSSSKNHNANYKHQKDHSVISSNTFLNLQQYQEHHFVELRFKLEEEVIKNENLERKIRNLEFDHIVKSNEQQRKIQDLELKNQQLNKQINELEKIKSKTNYHNTKAINKVNDNIQEINKMNKQNEMKSQQKGNNFGMESRDEFLSEMEHKLIQYENEILLLKERETELLSQINTMRSENFDLRLKTERFSFLASKEQQHSASPRKTYQIQKSHYNAMTASQRQTSGPVVIASQQNNIAQQRSHDNLSAQKPPIPHHNGKIQQQQQHFHQNIQTNINHNNHSMLNSQMRLTMNMNNISNNFNNSLSSSQMKMSYVPPSPYNKGISQRVSVISSNGLLVPQNLFAKINNEQVNVENLHELQEAQNMILQISAEKEQLEQDLQQIKEKSVNLIIEKEKQIIELIQYHEVQIDDIRQENSRLQLELKTLQRGERKKDDEDNQLTLRFDREMTQLKTELEYSEDKYEKFYHKYIEERRQQDNDIAFMQDKYQKDAQYYESKIEKLKEKNKALQDEKDRMNGKFLQSQDFKQEIIKELEDYEQRLKESEQEKHQLEKDFKYKLETQKQIIQDKAQRIKELQDQLFSIEDELKQSKQKDSQSFTQQISSLKDELSSAKRKNIDLENEIDSLKRQIEVSDMKLQETSNKKRMLNEMVQNIQKQRKDLEDSYKDKIQELECQIDSQQSSYLQQIQSLKTTIDMLENMNQGGGLMYGGAVQLKNSDYDQEQLNNGALMSDERNQLQTRQSTTYNEGQGITFNTQSTYQNQSPTFGTQNKQSAPQGLSLMDELCDDQFRYSTNQMNNFSSPNRDLVMRDTQYNMSPRQSMLSNAQFYQYQPEILDNSQLRATYMSTQNRPTYNQQQQQQQPRESQYSMRGSNAQINIDQLSDRGSVNVNTINYESNNNNLRAPPLSQSIQQLQEQPIPMTATSSGSINKYQNNIFKLKMKKGASESSDKQALSSSHRLHERESLISSTNNNLVNKHPLIKPFITTSDIQVQTDDQVQHNEKSTQLQYQSQIQQLEYTIREFENQLDQTFQRISDLEGQLFMKETGIDMANEELQKLQTLCDEKDDDIQKFEDQIELLENELQQFKESNVQMSQEYQKTLQQYQEKYKESILEIQGLRKQNLQLKQINHNHNMQIQSSQQGLTSEVLTLKKKLRSLENQNEDLLEQMISQKQQYSSENNHLRIELSTVEDQLMKLKLTQAQVTMEKDLLYLRYKDLMKSNKQLKDLLNRNQSNLIMTLNANKQQRQQQNINKISHSNMNVIDNNDSNVKINLRKDSGKTSFKSMRSQHHKRTESEQVINKHTTNIDNTVKATSSNNINEQTTAGYFTLGQKSYNNAVNKNAQQTPIISYNKPLLQQEHQQSLISQFILLQNDQNVVLQSQSQSQHKMLSTDNVILNLQNNNNDNQSNSFHYNNDNNNYMSKLDLIHQSSSQSVKVCHNNHYKNGDSNNSNSQNGSQGISPVRGSLMSNKSERKAKRSTVDWNKNFN